MEIFVFHGSEDGKFKIKTMHLERVSWQKADCVWGGDEHVLSNIHLFTRSEPSGHDHSHGPDFSTLLC